MRLVLQEFPPVASADQIREKKKGLISRAGSADPAGQLISLHLLQAASAVTLSPEPFSKIPNVVQ